jgi:hypothetical protein
MTLRRIWETGTGTGTGDGTGDGTGTGIWNHKLCIRQNKFEESGI